jgi:hypothetical protein
LLNPASPAFLQLANVATGSAGATASGLRLAALATEHSAAGEEARQAAQAAAAAAAVAARAALAASQAALVAASARAWLDPKNPDLQAVAAAEQEAQLRALAAALAADLAEQAARDAATAAIPLEHSPCARLALTNRF